MTSLQAKNEQRVRNLQKLPENKRCFTCTRTGLQPAVVFPFGIFVCTNCSGLHRQFSHQVATINMVNFTDKQVATLEANGNHRANELWLANFTSFPREGATPEKLSQFIQFCFQEKRWALRDGQQPQPQQQQPQQQQRPQSQIDKPNLSVNVAATSSHGSDALTPHSSLRRPTISVAPTPSSQSQGQSSFSQPQPVQQQPQQQQRPMSTTQAFPDFLSGSANPTPIIRPQSNTMSGPPETYAQIIFPGTVQPASFSPNRVESLKAMSKVMAQSIVEYGLTATEFYELVSTAAQVTANSWAQREAKQSGTVAHLAINMGALPPAGQSHSAPQPAPQVQQPAPQPQQQTPQVQPRQTPQVQPQQPSTLDIFSQMSLSATPVIAPQPAPQPTPQPQQQQPQPQQQQQLQQQPQAQKFPQNGPHGDWNFANPSTAPGSASSGDDFFGDLVTAPPAGPNQGQPQNPGFGAPQPQNPQMGGYNQSFQPQPQQNPQMGFNNNPINPNPGFAGNNGGYNNANMGFDARNSQGQSFNSVGYGMAPNPSFNSAGSFGAPNQMNQGYGMQGMGQMGGFNQPQMGFNGAQSPVPMGQNQQYLPQNHSQSFNGPYGVPPMQQPQPQQMQQQQPQQQQPQQPQRQQAGFDDIDLPF